MDENYKQELNEAKKQFYKKKIKHLTKKNPRNWFREIKISHARIHDSRLFHEFLLKVLATMWPFFPFFT